MNVTTCSFTRYYMYDQAGELEKRGYLNRLITNYPKSQTRRFGASDNNVKSLLYTGILHRILRHSPRSFKKFFRPVLVKYMVDTFSNSVVKHIPPNTDIFIGLTLYALDGLKKANDMGAITAVDSGSIYLKFQQEIIDKEKGKFGIDKGPRIKEWAIQKEDKEFEEADYVFLPSEFAKETFIKGGIDGRKIKVNPYGVDLKDFKAIEKRDEVFRVMFVGGMTLSKGIHYLIKAFNDADIPNSELCMVGPGWPNQEVRTALEQMNTNTANVKFLGAKPQKDLYKYYSDASVFVFPSLADGYGLVVPQSLSCGTPVIVSSNAGSKDIIEDGYNGYKVDVCDSEAIKDKLIYLSKNPELLKEMKKNSIQSVLNGLTWNDYGDRLASILDEMKKVK